MKKFILATASILIFVAPPLFADDDCVVAKATPAFLSQRSQLQHYKVRREKNIVIETFQLKDGTDVQVSQGGCVHFDKSVTFTLHGTKGKTPLPDSKLLITQANDLLSKLPSSNPMGKALQTQLKKQKEALLTQQPILQGQKYELEASDSNNYETMRLERIVKGSTVEVTISVNTAL